MMELFLNEKSLDGQFASVAEFSERGIVGLIAVLEDVKRLSVPVTLYKSEDIANAKVTATQTYPEVLFGEESRIQDGIRRYKIQLLSLLNEPYWNRESHQNASDQYASADGESLNGTSIAEAESRGGVLASFAHPKYSANEVGILKNGSKVSVCNVFGAGHLTDTAYQKAFIRFKEYAALKFEGQKLDFTEATDEKVWDVIPANIEKQVYDAFDAFCKESWFDIPQNKGLGYKPYHKDRKNNRYFTTDQWSKGIKEFRVSDKYRCFGYADGGKFYLLMIDLGHVLGNL